VRSLCLIRETLGYSSGLAEFAFAMQGLGSGPISLFGSDALKQKYLPGVAQGTAVAAFAISEVEAGSDIAAMRTTARRDGDSIVIDGEKTWISNAGIASHYVVFCRWPEGGDRGFIALVVDADAQGRLHEDDRRHRAAPARHDQLSGCRVPLDRVIGDPGKGMRVALGTLDLFRDRRRRGTRVRAPRTGRRWRTSVTATRSDRRCQVPADAGGDRRHGDRDPAALLVYRAAWTRDHGAERVTREAAMAKLVATESAQQVIDRAVQLLGARGVVRGETVERLYREIRALRIYEGTSEVQKIVIAGQVLNG
jgi:alkylation response protein AidB-like acyl-CoA dehydrogenase